MFLFFPFILPVNLISYLHRVRGSQTYALLRKVPHRRRGNEEQLLSSSSSNTPFLSSISLSLITIVLTIRKKKKKKKGTETQSHSLSRLFFSFFLTFFFLFFTLYYIFIYHPSRSFLRKRNLFSLPMATSQQPRKRDRTKGKGRQKDEILLFSRIFHPLYSSTNKQRRKVDGGKTHNNPSRRSLTLVPL